MTQIASFRFLHAADIHLDSPLRGLSRYEGVPADDIRTATRTALDNLVACAIREAVRFVVVAGDVYDGDWEDFGTGLYFCRAMGLLEQAGIAVYLLRGNHDAASIMTKSLPLPGNVHVFNHLKPETFEHAATGTVLHGHSYRERDPGSNLAAGYPPARAGRLNIGVLHTALAGGYAGHAPYAPCTVADLQARDYDYWALGHIHDFAVIARAPHIVFSGNLQGRHIGECGAKGAVLVSVEDGRVADVVHLPLDTVRWARLEIAVAGMESEADIHNALRAALRRAVTEEANGRPLVVRVVLSGSTALHGVLADKRTALREEVRAIATAVSDRMWVEKVQLATAEVAAASDASLVSDASLLMDVGQLIDRGAIDAALLETLKADYGDLLSRLPGDIEDAGGFLASVRGGSLEPLLRDAAVSLKSRIAGAG